MKSRSRFFSLLIAIGVMMAAVPGDTMTALAASRKTISKVSIELDLDLSAGDSLPDLSPGEKGSGNNVMASSDWYVADEADWVSSTNKDVKIGSTYTLKVTLTAHSPDDYGFQGTYKASNVTVKNGTFVSASRKGYDTLVVTVKTKPVKGEFEAPSDADWKDRQLGMAEWEKADNVDAYDVTLYRGSSSVYKVTGFKGTKINFYPYMTSAGTYTFKVRSVADGESQKDYAKSSEWTESSEVYIAKESVSDGSGRVDYNNNGSSGNGSNPGVTTGQVGWLQEGGRWCYRYPDGSYQKNSWLLVGDKWYLFDTDGWMKTGWQEKDNYWYYLDTSGAMRTGWIQAANGWYFLNPGPVAGPMWRSQWLNWNNKMYYLTDNGVMAEGWKDIGGKWYYFYPGEGSMAVNTTINSFMIGSDGVWYR